MKKMLALSISTCTQCPWYNKTPPRCKHPDWSGPAPLQEDPLLLEGPVCWDQHCPLPSEPCALNDLLQNLAEQMPFQPFFVKEAFNNNPGPPMESLEQVIADKAAALIDKRKIAEMEATIEGDMKTGRVVDPTVQVALDDALSLQAELAK